MDEHWKISCETAIKARSVTGYATCNRKMILNKFLEGDPKVKSSQTFVASSSHYQCSQCELLDDWDQRCVTSVLRWDRGQGSLTLEQTAETGDNKGRLDGRVTYQVWSV